MLVTLTRNGTILAQVPEAWLQSLVAAGYVTASDLLLLSDTGATWQPVGAFYSSTTSELVNAEPAAPSWLATRWLSMSNAAAGMVTNTSALAAKTWTFAQAGSGHVAGAARNAWGWTRERAGALPFGVITPDALSSWHGIIGRVMDPGGVATLYDKAMDAVYNQTHAGGGMHRLFDGSHTLWGAWECCAAALPDDTFSQRTAGYLRALAKDFVTAKGLPVMTLDRAHYEVMATWLESLGVSRAWLYDLLSVDPGEMFGAVVGTLGVALAWQDADVTRFTELSVSLGFSSLASASPLGMLVALVGFGRCYHLASQDTNLAATLGNAATRTGLRSAMTWGATGAAGLLFGPGWVVAITGIAVGMSTHHVVSRVDVSMMAQASQTAWSWARKMWPRYVFETAEERMRIFLGDPNDPPVSDASPLVTP